MTNSKCPMPGGTKGLGICHWDFFSHYGLGMSRLPRHYPKWGFRQINPKATAFPELRFQADAAAHPFDGFSDDGQPDSGPGIFFNAMEAFEEVEDSVMMFGRDADAIVFDVDPNQPRSLFGPNDHLGSN